MRAIAPPAKRSIRHAAAHSDPPAPPLLRVDGFLLDGDKIVSTRTTTPREYEAACTPGRGCRASARCLHCLAPLPPDSKDSRRFCDDKWRKRRRCGATGTGTPRASSELRRSTGRRDDRGVYAAPTRISRSDLLKPRALSRRRADAGTESITRGRQESSKRSSCSAQRSFPEDPAVRSQSGALAWSERVLFIRRRCPRSSRRTMVIEGDFWA